MNAELKITGRLAEVGNLDGGSTPGASIYAGDGRYIEVHNLSEDEARAIAPAFGEMVTVSIALAERTTADVSALTDSEIEKLAYRRCTKYLHVPSDMGIKYQFSAHHLSDFVRNVLAAAPAPIQQESEAPARQALHTMEYEDGRIGWYFDCEGHYIDVEKDNVGKYSVHFRDRATGKEGWLDQADAATPPALVGSQVQAAGDAVDAARYRFIKSKIGMYAGYWQVQIPATSRAPMEDLEAYFEFDIDAAMRKKL